MKGTPNMRITFQKRLERTAWLELGSKGQILEWDREYEEADPHHRHLSFLYALYPAKMIHTKQLAQACRRSLELRGDAGTGWSCAWKNMYVGDAR